MGQDMVEAFFTSAAFAKCDGVRVTAATQRCLSSIFTSFCGVTGTDSRITHYFRMKYPAEAGDTKVILRDRYKQDIARIGACIYGT